MLITWSFFFPAEKHSWGWKHPRTCPRGDQKFCRLNSLIHLQYFSNTMCALRQQRRIRLEKIWLNFEKKIAFVAHKYHQKFLFNFLPPSSTVPKIFLTTWKLKRVVFNYVRAKLQIFWNFIVAEFVSLDPLPYGWHAIIWIRFEVDYGNFIQWQILIVVIA